MSRMWHSLLKSLEAAIPFREPRDHRACMRALLSMCGRGAGRGAAAGRRCVRASAPSVSATTLVYEEFVAWMVEERWPSALRASRALRARTVGREAEFPIVWKAGHGRHRPAGTAADGALVLRKLAEALPSSAAKLYFLSADAEEDSSSVAEREPLLASVVLPQVAEFAWEVGRGTIEVTTAPAQSLHDIRDIHERAVKLLVHTLEELGMAAVGLGCQPITPPSPRLLTPKPRYLSLLHSIGENWLSFTVTASDQTHVALYSLEELSAAQNVAHICTPAVIALCANSSMLAGRAWPVDDARDLLMGAIDTRHHRYGMPRHPVASVDAFIRTLGDMPSLVQWNELRPEAGDGTNVRKDGDPDAHLQFLSASTARRFADMVPTLATAFDVVTDNGVGGVGVISGDGYQLGHLSEEDRVFAALERSFAAHEHYTWNYARPREQFGTIELRAACQQPWSEHMVVAALNLGIVEAWVDLHQELERQYPLHVWWDVATQLLRRVVVHGLSDSSGTVPPPTEVPVYTEHASQPHELDLLRFCERVLFHAETGLRRRGLEEEQYLTPLHARLLSQRNPAREARELFHEQGMAAVLEQRAVRVE